MWALRGAEIVITMMIYVPITRFYAVVNPAEDMPCHGVKKESKAFLANFTMLPTHHRQQYNNYTTFEYIVIM